MRHDLDPVRHLINVSVPFNAGRGLMRNAAGNCVTLNGVSVPFNAGRGLMQSTPTAFKTLYVAFQYPSMRVVD